jgi:ABC-type lipoprotein export system ATPase subunit
MVLEDINLTVQQGESVAIIGPSGSGKSTLLNIIGTLDEPDSGSVVLEKQNLEMLTSKELARIRNQKIGFIFQLHHLLPQCTVLENVLIPVIPAGSGKDSGGIEKRAINLLDMVGLGNHKDHRPSQLSGGEQQRVAVVRALINNPVLLLADEPTGSLDRKNAENLTGLLVELNREEKTSLITVTHSSELAKRMQTSYNLENGRLKKL